MKEIMAIIRQSMMKETLAALSEIGVDSVTVHSVNGRGRQGGNIMETRRPGDEDGRRVRFEDIQVPDAFLDGRGSRNSPSLCSGSRRTS